MTLTSGLFNSVNGDRRYRAEHFAAYFATFIGNGVFPNPSTGLQITSIGNMTVTMKPGQGWINGYFITNDDDYNLVLDVADGVLKRIDRVVLQLNYADRMITPVVKKGVFSSSPIAPTLQRDADIYELALADIFVGNGVLSVSQANITDQRLNSALCGIVHGVIDQVDTTAIFDQYQAWFDQTKVQNENEIDLWIQQEQSEFDSWFATVQSQLSGDVAGNLQNQITQHETDDTSHVRFAVDTGTANVKVITLVPAPTAYVEGMAFAFKNALENTSSVTLEVNGLGPVEVVKSNGSSLSSGNLKAGSIYTVRKGTPSFILQGEGGEYGTAGASEVRTGYTIGTDAGLISGTIPNKTAQTYTPSTSNQTISSGQYLSGTQTILGDPDLTPSNILSGKNIFGVVGTVIKGDYKVGDYLQQSNLENLLIPASNVWSVNKAATYIWTTGGANNYDVMKISPSTGEIITSTQATRFDGYAITVSPICVTDTGNLIVSHTNGSTVSRTIGYMSTSGSWVRGTVTTGGTSPVYPISYKLNGEPFSSTGFYGQGYDDINGLVKMNAYNSKAWNYSVLGLQYSVSGLMPNGNILLIRKEGQVAYFDHISPSGTLVAQNGNLNLAYDGLRYFGGDYFYRYNTSTLYKYSLTGSLVATISVNSIPLGEDSSTDTLYLRISNVIYRYKISDLTMIEVLQNGTKLESFGGTNVFGKILKRSDNVFFTEYGKFSPLGVAKLT